MGKLIDITGQKFGRLTAVEHLGDGRWTCQCDCGNTYSAKGSHLRGGTVKSCGCLKRDRCREVHTTHNATGQRCHKQWSRLKRDGVCREWEDAATCMKWLTDNYAEGQILFRLDLDKPHSPGNTFYGSPSCRNITRPPRTNSPVGIKGVYEEPDGAFRAHLAVHGRKLSKRVGTLEEAVRLRKKWERMYHKPVIDHYVKGYM